MQVKGSSCKLSIRNNQRGRKPERDGDSWVMINYEYNSDVKESDCTPGFSQARYFEEMQKKLFKFLTKH